MLVYMFLETMILVYVKLFIQLPFRITTVFRNWLHKFAVVFFLFFSLHFFRLKRIISPRSKRAAVLWQLTECLSAK